MISLGMLTKALYLYRIQSFTIVPMVLSRVHMCSLRFRPLSVSSLIQEENVVEPVYDVGKNSSSEEFNPLGPPSNLASLNVGESSDIPLMDYASCSVDIVSVTRLSRNPDIFLARNFVKNPETFIQAGKQRGLKQAGTRKSDENTVRKHSFLTWLDNKKDEITSENNRCYMNAVSQTTKLAKSLFVHETLQNSIGNDNSHALVSSEDMQVAKYDDSGSYDLHHDGYNRFLTVLHYLNGVGGTFFPLAQTTSKRESDAEPPIIQMDENRISLQNYEPGRDGLLLVGKEGIAAYSSVLQRDDDSNNCIVNIQAGDSIVFYNYNLSENILGDGQNNKEWRSIHAALPVTTEKWISTNWFRSTDLTGPFAHFHRERLLEDCKN